MKRTPLLLLLFAVFFMGWALVRHVHSGRVRAGLERERRQLLAITQQIQAEKAETSRLAEVARTRAVPAPMARSKAKAPAAPAPAVSVAATRDAAAPAAPNPELRQLRAQTFAGEQRMQFEPLLQRLHFTAEQRQAFDRINEEFYRAMLDPKLDASGRQVAKDAKSAALRELFGPHHEAWLEANREQFARAMVDGIVALTFPSSGALNAAQADELTRVIDQHRVSPSDPPAARANSKSYDWDLIIADARTILADRQMDDFAAAVRYRRTSEQMSAMAAPAKR